MDKKRSKLRLIAAGIVFLIGGWVLLSSITSPDSEVVLVSSSFRQRLGKEASHPLITRQQTLDQRSITQHTSTTDIALTFPLPTTLMKTLSGEKVNQQVSWNVVLTSQTSYYPHGWLGSSSVALHTRRSLSSTGGTLGEYDIQWAFSFIRSWTDIRSRLDSLEVIQSGQESIDLLIWQGVLNEYSGKRIFMTWSILPNLFTANIFGALSNQSSQHIIPTRSGEVLLLIQGDDLVMSGTISPQHQLSAMISFLAPAVQVLLTQSSEKNDYTFAILYDDLKSPLASGDISFAKKFGSLVATVRWAASTQGGLIRTGEHTSTFTPTSFLSVELPRESTPRPTIQELWDAKSINE